MADQNDVAEAPPSIRPVRELAIGLAVFALYLVVDALGGPARRAAGTTHAQDLFRLETRLHIDLEPRANAWLDLHPLLRTLANYEYGSSYIIAAFGLLAWLYFRRPQEYRRARSSFVLLNVIAIGCFALYPVTPPRLLGGPGFVDTVTLGHTVGSWGSPLVAHANQLAAMPSLHVGWALWVSVVLARISGGWKTQLSSAAHVALTTWVVVATANHYLLDAVGAVVAVTLAALVLRAIDLIDSRMRLPARPSTAVPAADSFFLHIESDCYPQQVGGVVPLDVSDRTADSPSRGDVVELIRDRLGELPRFRQLLAPATSRWGRPHWRPVEELDWDWHVPLRDLTRPDGSPGGEQAFDELVAELAATPLPPDRPLWRMVVVHGVAADRSAVVLIVHHVIADGIGTVAQALRLLEPPLPPLASGQGRPGPLRRAGAIGLGLAQLATDGHARPLAVTHQSESDRPEPDRSESDRPEPEAESDAGPGPGRPGRSFARLQIPLPAVKVAARAADARVSDLLLAAVAGGLSRLELPAGRPLPDRLRVAVPLMVREPGAAAEGNVTAAVMIDLPVGPMPEPERLRLIAGRSARLRTGSRALASRFVMATVAGWMPRPMHAWFARTVYGSWCFHAIVSNMPGPAVPLSLAKVPLVGAYPLLPLAPGTALTVGTLGWDGSLCLAVSTGGWLEPQAQALIQGIRASLLDLGVAGFG